MLGAIRTTGSISIYSFDMAINYVDRVGGLTRIESSPSPTTLIATSVITSFKTSREYLFVGCASCTSN